MAFITTSRKFYDQITGTGGGGVSYLNSCVGDKMTCVIEGYFSWSFEVVNLTFVAATNKISLTQNASGEGRTFIQQGFKEGDAIEIAGTTSNDGTYTIVTISDRYITTVESIVDEVVDAANIYGTTLITAMDFYYNILPNQNSGTYASRTDKGTLQKYSVAGLDAAVVTPVYMNVGTDSYGWVTDTLTGDVSTVKIEGVSNTDHKQSFKITQTFYHAPIWTRELFLNFVNRRSPDEYMNGNSLKHIFRVDGKFDYYSPMIAHSGGIENVNGNSAWFNQNSVGQKPEYKVVSVVYEDDVTSTVVSKIDFQKKTNVTIIVASRSGKFATSSPFVLSHILCPQDVNDYINTGTTLMQNIRWDGLMILAEDPAANGQNFGTSYQALTSIMATIDGDMQVTITFSVEYSAATKALLSLKKDGNRYYSFYISCQDRSIGTTKNIDRVSLLVDFQSMDYNPSDSTLLGLKDYFHGFPYPNTEINEINNVQGFEGDFFYERIPFWLETLPVNGISPTLNKTTLRIVATKSGEQDFVLEEKIFNSSLVRKLNGIQDINITNSRNFILPEESVWNNANLIRRKDYDAGTKAYYEIQYGFVLRYEEWIEVVQAALANQYPVFKDIKNVSEAWKRYSSGNGWAMKLKIEWEVLGYDNAITIFTSEIAITVLEPGDSPASGPVFTSVIKYYDDKNEPIDSIIKNDVTRVVVVFTGDVSTMPPDMVQNYGFLFVNKSVNGSIMDRLTASSDIDSEEGSPFSAANLPQNGAISSHSSANMRISYFNDRIELDAFYNDDSRNAGESIYVYGRVGYAKEFGIGEMQINNTFIVR